MGTIRVLATGGTIASRTDAAGVAVAREGGADLVARLRLRGDVRVEVEDIFAVGGYLMTLERMRELALRARDCLRDDDVIGVVVTHGTDTIEESALFLDLFCDTDKPVVFTGAQRPADAPDSDGPRNLAEAIAVASAASARGLGVLVVFDGPVLAARGASKMQTVASSAFSAPGLPALGWARGTEVHVEHRPRRPPPLDLDALDLRGVRVDIAACYPGVDATAVQAFVEAGATGIVLQAMGAGNANPEICNAVRDLTSRGVVVALSTRVPAGPVAAIYGNGGGADLIAAGAVPTGLLRPGQARIVLAALLGVYRQPDVVREVLRAYTSG